MKLTQIRNIFLYLFLVCFFFYPRFQTGFIALAFFTTFFTGEFLNFKQTVLKNKLGLSMMLFFIIHVLSMLWTENQIGGWRSIESKFSLIAFPLFLPVIFYNGIKMESVFKFFNLIALVYILLSLGNYFYNFFVLGNIPINIVDNLNFKFSSEARNLHPTYVSFYLLTIILYNGNELLNNIHNRRKTIFSIAGILSLSMLVLFLSSKVAFIGLFIVIFLLLGKYARQNGKIKQALLLFILFLGVALIGIYKSNLRIKFEQTYEELTNTNRTNKSYVQSTGARIWFWKTTTEVIKENPILGVGTGDIRDELSKKYQEKGIIYIQDKGMDSHQQYLQTFAATGLFGFLSLLSMFLLLFYDSIKNRKFLLFGFTLLYFIFGFTESMLETQAGLVFFTFFALYLSYYNQVKKSI